MSGRTPYGLSTFEEIDYILRDETLYTVRLPRPDLRLGGRPPKYPDYMVCLYGEIVQVFRTARRVGSELQHPLVWAFIRERIFEMFPHNPEMWLPEEPMKRGRYSDMKKLLIEDEGALAEFAASTMGGGIDLVRELGLMNPSASLTCPSLDNTLYGDGKVITPPFKARRPEVVDLETGEIIRYKVDPDAKLYREAGGTVDAFGTKFVVVAARCDLGRVILGIDYVSENTEDPRGKRGEVGRVLGLLDQILPQLPGAYFFAYDGALRGTHAQHLLRNHGVQSITRIHAETAEKTVDGEKIERVAKGGLLEVRDIEVSPGVIRPVAIHVKDGQPGVYKINVEGEEVFDAFFSLDVESRRNGSGLFRLYKNYRLPKDLGGGTERIRLYGTDKDKGGPERRPEILRSIPPGTRDFERLYGRRADIESINRAIEDRLYWNRSHSVGYRGGLFDLLCFARLTNAITKGKARALGAKERSA